MNKYGSAMSAAGAPHLRPRRVRSASSAMFVGMKRRKIMRVYALRFQMRRNMGTVLSKSGGDRRNKNRSAKALRCADTECADVAGRGRLPLGYALA